jgi:hypothetical protein
MDFVVIARVRARFGSSPSSPGAVDFEDSAPFVGRSKTWEFDCPNIDRSGDAVLAFQELGVSSNRHLLSINGALIAGGIPMGGFLSAGPSDVAVGIWSAELLLVPPNVLRQTENQLTVDARNRDGGATGEVENFVLDNLVLFYKTLAGRVIGSAAT